MRPQHFAAVWSGTSRSGARGPRAHQRHRLHRFPRLPTDLIGENLRLVEAAPEQPQAGQGRRHDDVGFRDEFATRLRQPAAEQSAAVVRIAKLQIVHEVAHQAVEKRDGARPVVNRRIGGRGSGDHRSVAAIRQRQSGPVAERRPYEVDFSPALGAQRIVIGDTGFASKAKWGQYEVEGGAADCAKDRAKPLRRGAAGSSSMAWDGSVACVIAAE